MLTIKVEIAENDGIILNLDGEIVLETVARFREALLQGLREQFHVQLDCEKVTAIDFFGIQLLCSAHRSSVTWEKRLTWVGSLPTTMEDTIEKTGFARHRGCELCPDDVCCMWQ